MKPQPRQNTRLDRAAIALSGLCLVHCLALPVALLLGTAANQWLIKTETEVHWVLFALAVPLSGLALWKGYSKHRVPSVPAFGASGLLLMLLGVSHAFSPDLEATLTTLGVVLLLVAHVRNLTLGHRHAHRHA